MNKYCRVNCNVNHLPFVLGTHLRLLNYKVCLPQQYTTKLQSIECISITCTADPRYDMGTVMLIIGLAEVQVIQIHTYHQLNHSVCNRVFQGCGRRSKQLRLTNQCLFLFSFPVNIFVYVYFWISIRVRCLILLVEQPPKMGYPNNCKIF